MSLVAVVGQRCTTTAIGLASAWPALDHAVLLEIDPSGGCAAAWLGLARQPGLSDVVAGGDPARWAAIEQRIQQSESGVSVLVAPTRTTECAAAVAAAAPMLTVLSAHPDVFIADVGRLPAALPSAVAQAGVVIVSHVQHSGSAAAAALGLERVADQCATLALRSLPTIVVVHGTWPYGVDEIQTFLGVRSVVLVPEDPWAAAVVAGRPGSSRRLQRSAWWGAMEDIANRAADELVASGRGAVLIDRAGHG